MKPRRKNNGYCNYHDRRNIRNSQTSHHKGSRAMNELFEYPQDITVLLDLMAYVDRETNCDDPDPRLPNGDNLARIVYRLESGNVKIRSAFEKIRKRADNLQREMAEGGCNNPYAMGECGEIQAICDEIISGTRRKINDNLETEE